MEIETILEPLMHELTMAVKGMAKAKSLDEKVAHSKVIRNLSEALGVFLSLDMGTAELEDEH